MRGFLLSKVREMRDGLLGAISEKSKQTGERKSPQTYRIRSIFV
jgi:hypothetical protein